MMIKKIQKSLFIVIVMFCLISSTVVVKASAPYITQTVDRYGDLVETQDAYEPILSIKNIKTGIDNTTLNNAQDLFIDDDDYLYIADTNNKRVVILNDKLEYINSFGNDLLIQPLGLFVRDSFIYVADYGDVNDNNSGKIVVYEYNKETNIITHNKTFSVPNSNLLQVDNFIFRPQKIAVDQNYTMYIVCKGSSNGVLLVNSNNRFLNYFAPNSTTGTFWDSIKYYLYGNNENVLLTQNIPPAPTNVMLDDSGYIYTVTSTIVKNSIGDTLKKVNIGGLNFYPDDMVVASSFVDSWASDYKTIYALTSNGYIYEYDIEGNLLFKFSGPIGNDEQLGLFKAASSIACDSKGQLYVLDPNANTIQLFRKTIFTTKVHNALVLYMSGKYIESKNLWEEVLRYNSMFDLAHKAIGLAYYLEGDYAKAMEKFEIANAKEEYSEAFWEERNIWLMNNVTTVIVIFAILLIGLVVVIKTNERYQYLSFIKKGFMKFKNLKEVKSFSIFFKFIKHPLDAVYEVKHNKNIKVYDGIIMLFIIFGIYIINITCTSFLFNDVILEKTILLKEASKIILPIFLFVFANYLISSLMSGEGTLRAIFINTIGSLIPIVIMLPFIILISNVLTYNEGFIYYFSISIMYIWTFILLFVVTKETHNYSVSQTIANFFLTLLMMVIIIIVGILIYLVIVQVITFIVDLTKEAIF